MVNVPTRAGTTTPLTVRERTFTRREFMLYAAMLGDSPVSYDMATEAVSSWALDHPEVDMDEMLTWEAWAADEHSS